MANACLDDGHQGGPQADRYRRVELITGEARRRRWTADEKAEILAESFQPGARVSQVARRYGVNRGLLWSWRHQARKDAAAAGRMFVPIRIASETTAPLPSTAVQRHDDAAVARAAQPDGNGAGSIGGTIEVEIGGARVLVHGAVDTTALRQVLRHLGRRA
ncbi:MAG: IS66-like element accessory protein TnpA [Acetobacteraceae bacterium]